MMGCDGACAAGFDLVFIGLPLLSLYEIPMLIWFIWRVIQATESLSRITNLT